MAMMRTELDLADEQIARQKEELNDLRTFKTEMTRKMADMDKSLAESNAGLKLMIEARACLGVTITEAARKSRMDTIFDFLKSDSQHFLKKMNEIDIRSDAYYHLIGQMKTHKILPESFSILDPRINVVANHKGVELKDDRLSYDRLAEDEFWYLVAPADKRPATVSHIYPSWFPGVMAAGRVDNPGCSYSNDDWMDLPGPIHGYEQVVVEDTGRRVWVQKVSTATDPIAMNEEGVYNPSLP